MNEYIKIDNNIKLGDSLYHAKNDQMEITAQIKRLNDFKVSISIIKYKYKNGSQTLKKHYASWLAYVLQEKGFTQKFKLIELKGEQKQ